MSCYTHIQYLQEVERVQFLLTNLQHFYRMSTILQETCLRLIKRIIVVDCFACKEERERAREWEREREKDREEVTEREKEDNIQI